MTGTWARFTCNTLVHATEEAGSNALLKRPQPEIGQLVQRPGHAAKVLERLRAHGHSWESVRERAVVLGVSLPVALVKFLASNKRLSMEQVWALSETTETRLMDWLDVLGYGLDRLPKYQHDLYADKTHPCPRNLFQLDYKQLRVPFSALAGASLERTTMVADAFPDLGLLSLREISAFSHPRFRYGCVSQYDGRMAKLLSPGDFFRYDITIREPNAVSWTDELTRPIWYIEHFRGSCCSWLDLDEHAVFLRARDLRYPALRLKSGEYRILGLVDAVLHRFDRPRIPSPQIVQAAMRKNPLPTGDEAAVEARHYIRQGRLRAHLSLRDAITRSEVLASKLGDKGYLLSRASIWDFEHGKGRPHTIETFIGLTVVCLLELEGLLQRYGLLDHEDQKQPLFPERVEHHSPSHVTFGQTEPLTRSGYFQQLRAIWEDPALPVLPFLANWRWEDMAVLGIEDNLLGGLAKPGALLLIDRKRHKSGKWQWREKPVLELVATRDSLYCGTILESNGIISVIPLSGSSQGAQHFPSRSVYKLGFVIAIATRF
jgi:hypothetical protein